MYSPDLFPLKGKHACVVESSEPLGKLHCRDSDRNRFNIQLIDPKTSDRFRRNAFRTDERNIVCCRQWENGRIYSANVVLDPTIALNGRHAGLV